MPADSAAQPAATGTTLGRHPLLDVGRPLGRAVRVALVVAAGAALLLLRVPMCPFATFVHQPCPGCGLTRATLALLHGDVSGAAHLHPLVFLVTPLVTLVFSYNAYTYVRRGEVFATEARNSRIENAAWIALAAAMILLWIARFFGAFGGPVPV